MADNKIIEDACTLCGGCPFRSMAENEYRRKKRKISYGRWLRLKMRLLCLTNRYLSAMAAAVVPIWLCSKRKSAETGI